MKLVHLYIATFLLFFVTTNILYATEYKVAVRAYTGIDVAMKS